MNEQLIAECLALIKRTDGRYGPFTSTHEALGVLDEEFDELRASIRHNALADVRHEAIDIAAAALRLADACRGNESFAKRSNK